MFFPLPNSPTSSPPPNPPNYMNSFTLSLKHKQNRVKQTKEKRKKHTRTHHMLLCTV